MRFACELLDAAHGRLSLVRRTSEQGARRAPWPEQQTLLL